ncbi:MAG: hypothetical protein AAFV86_09235 [Pseudomonadota bacterium]
MRDAAPEAEKAASEKALLRRKALLVKGIWFSRSVEMVTGQSADDDTSA